MGDVLKFSPLQSCVDLSFWSELSNRKLDEYQLSETPIDITGHYSASRHQQLSSNLQVLSSSFDAEALVVQQGRHAAPGVLVNANTLEAFKALDKPRLLRQVVQRIWSDICSGAAERDPSLLLRFLLLSFGDLKHYRFTYLFAFPALKPPQPFVSLGAAALNALLPDALAQQVVAACDRWRHLAPALDAGDAPQQQQQQQEPQPFWLLRMPGEQEGPPAGVLALPLSEWAACAATPRGRDHGGDGGDGGDGCGCGPSGGDVWVAMADPCHLALLPGWPLRNLLLLAAQRWRVRQLRVLCVRDSRGRTDPGRSFVLTVQLPELPPGWRADEPPEAAGWEANAQGRLVPRQVNVSSSLDPLQLAEQAVDLNLRLMRWRAAPSLDITAIANTRCLLLGAGTLGCAAARTLLAWGVRSLTLIDSGRVAYSNPVRQNLFVHADCAEGGRPKAAAAANALRAVFPAVEAVGVELAVPMPGHPPSGDAARQEMRQAIQQLDALVAACDVVFLLTDTRESRWLPTLLAAARQKIAITAALGFDSFVVMRHGLPAPHSGAGLHSGVGAADGARGGDGGGSGGAGAAARSDGSIRGGRLGCYFCNDVVAPINSTNDRTLDQQCTVARPGLAPIAAALAVELMAALLQHPARGRAPAPGAGGGGGALGEVPHMIRGRLSSFSQVVMEGCAFSQCTACSPAVLDAHKARGVEFVEEVVGQPALLEELTGLAELQRQAAALADSGSDGGGSGCEGLDGGSGDGDWTEL